MTRPHITSDAAMSAAMRAMEGPFARGTNDCVIAAGDAFLELFGVDFVAPLRGAYSTAAEAEAMLDAAGGSLLEVVAGRAADLGMVPLDGPAWPGDLGIVMLVVPGGGQVEALAIFTGAGWACKSPRGMLHAPPRRARGGWRVV